MKHCIVTFCLFAFALQSFYNIIVIAEYHTNMAKYARICENKARPSMHCNGKCQMRKKLKEEAKKEKQNLERKGVKKIDSLCSKLFFAQLPEPANKPLLAKQPYPDFIAQNTQDQSFELLRPPSI